jgi:intergrase/recombinase
LLGKPYRDYLFEKYSYYYARNCYRYTHRLLLPIIKDKRKMLGIKKLSPRLQRAVLEAYAALRDFLRLFDLEVPLDREELVKYIDPIKPDLGWEEYSVDVVEEAQKYLELPHLWAKERLVCQIAYYTGLRGTEIAYLLKNYGRLPTMEFGNVVAVKLSFYRKKKNAHVTLMPRELYDSLAPTELGKRFFEHLRTRGVKISVFRDAHVAILSKTMGPHEIDFLQGRIATILVRHYIKHLPEIAEKYKKAYALTN